MLRISIVKQSGNLVVNIGNQSGNLVREKKETSPAIALRKNRKQSGNDCVSLVAELGEDIKAITWQSTTYRDGSSERALDGISTSIWWSHSCTHTIGETHNFWAVELTRPVKLEGIRIQFRSDTCCTYRNTGLTISVFDTRVAMESEEGADCETFSGPPEDSSTPVTIMCQEPVVGRIVRILQQNEEEERSLSLCEVTLIGPGLMQ
ncbi:FUCL6-like protein [Mya arenaria]|uniref:FUCL6-like protein n=1 Tax=Mya arenaria TaxID=6604 RepID=A0ABY7F2H7_MYAAR|nr:FUCL6-like protein [Mya arenaria]